MQRVRLTVPRRREYGPGDAFEVYSDGGTGSIDYERPLTSRPIAFWPDAEPAAGHLLDSHLRGRAQGAAAAGGHLDGAHLMGRSLQPERVFTFETELLYVGRYRFAVRVLDAAGNVRSDAEAQAEVVINTGPEPPESFVPSASNALTGRMRFSFAPSGQVG